MSMLCGCGTPSRSIAKVVDLTCLTSTTSARLVGSLAARNVATTDYDRQRFEILPKIIRAVKGNIMILWQWVHHGRFTHTLKARVLRRVCWGFGEE